MPQYTNYLDRTAYNACQAELASARNLVLAENSINSSVVSLADLADVTDPDDPIEAFEPSACASFTNTDITAGAFTGVSSRNSTVVRVGVDFADAQ